MRDHILKKQVTNDPAADGCVFVGLPRLEERNRFLELFKNVHRDEHQKKHTRTYFLNAIDGPATGINQRNLDGVERAVFYFVSRPKRDHLDAVLDSDFADEFIRELVCSWPQGVCIFAFPVNGNTPELLPRFSVEFDANGISFR